MKTIKKTYHATKRLVRCSKTPFVYFKNVEKIFAFWGACFVAETLFNECANITLTSETTSPNFLTLLQIVAKLSWLKITTGKKSLMVRCATKKSMRRKEKPMVTVTTC